MFGYVTASLRELTKEQQRRYGAVYCGICRRIRTQSGNLARLGLSYDMAFLALLLMSLYEPEEEAGRNGCLLHPITRRDWLDGPYIRYAADMNVALAYYNCLDDWQDDGKKSAKRMAQVYEAYLPQIEQRWPRQCRVIRECIEKLSALEKENCPNPDEPAGVFGSLMGELLAVREDLWAPTLRQMGNALGRFVYLLDAELDYDQDKRKGKYNPFLAKGEEKDWEKWEDYLVLTMGRCTANFEKLPLVQDKPLLDNILYSGVWVNYRRKRKEEESHD
ncbi:MAG: DUF5685 family protein [Candidatus Faecousia sp.]|nr:DUF5685 family protein [Candidatus Faecousia sp.]